ncbi:GDP-L-fucose synthase [compost metagenome]
MGNDVTIRELAELIREVTGFQGQIAQDLSKPDGTPQKLMDIRRISDLGWKPRVGLPEGVSDTYKWFVDRYAQGVIK